MKFKIFSILAAAGLIAAGSALATTASSDPVGFVTVNVPANSDAILAVPLNRTAEFKGTVASIAGNVITVSGTPGWTANQFVQSLPTQTKTYAVQFASGTKEGMIAGITANGTNTLTVQTGAGDDLTGIVNGEQLDVIPYWTPGSLLGTTLPAATEFAGFENVGAGINIAPTKVYGATGSSWEDGDTSEDVTHTPLEFGRAFVLRNNSGSPLTISMVGAVPMSICRIRLSTLGSNLDQDLRIGFLSPIPESIINLNIPAVAGDIISGFDNSATGKNKAAALTYSYDGTQWVNEDTGNPLTVADQLQPGFGYLFRKFRTANPTSVVWQKLPSYLQ